jgi:hypothetical protein
VRGRLGGATAADTREGVRTALGHKSPRVLAETALGEKAGSQPAYAPPQPRDTDAWGVVRVRTVRCARCSAPGSRRHDGTREPSKRSSGRPWRSPSPSRSWPSGACPPCGLGAARGPEINGKVPRIGGVNVELVPTREIGFCRLIQPPETARLVRAVHGIDQVSCAPGVDQVILAHPPGDPVDWREGSAGQVVTVHGRVPDLGALAQTIDFIDHTLQIEYVGDLAPAPPAALVTNPR